MKFIKYHALGNDYLVYAEPGPFGLDTAQVTRICDRNFGLGSDGILVLQERPQADALHRPPPEGVQPSGEATFAGERTAGHFRLRIINPDGSDAEKSGNGLRIFSRYLWDQGWVKDAWFDILTPGGPVQARVAPGGRSVEVAMGQADFSAPAVPVNVPAERAIDWPVQVLGQEVRINAVSMGNPHCVVFIDPATAETARTLGPQLERHALFPRRTNVQFVKVLDRGHLQIEIWERGAGYTLSSGTSSCAAAAVARLRGYCDASVVVQTAGGRLYIEIGDDWRIFMRGAVQRIGSLVAEPECFAPLEADGSR